MYDYEYEEDVMGALRLLKYLYLKDKGSLKSIQQTFPDVDADMMVEVADYAIWELFNNDFLGEEDEDGELSYITFSDSSIDEFLELNTRLLELQGISCQDAVRKKIRDAAEYFACSAAHSLFNLQVYFPNGYPVIRYWLSPDCYEAIALGNSILDMLLYFQSENQRLKVSINQADENGELSPQLEADQEAA